MNLSKFFAWTNHIFFTSLIAPAFKTVRDDIKNMRDEVMGRFDEVLVDTALIKALRQEGFTVDDGGAPFDPALYKQWLVEGPTK